MAVRNYRCSLRTTVDTASRPNPSTAIVPRWWYRHHDELQHRRNRACSRFSGSVFVSLSLCRWMEWAPRTHHFSSKCLLRKYEFPVGALSDKTRQHRRMDVRPASGSQKFGKTGKVGRSPNTELVKSILKVLALTFGLDTNGNGSTKQRRMGGMVERKDSFVCISWQASSACFQCITAFQDESKIHHLPSDMHVVLCPRDQA